MKPEILPHSSASFFGTGIAKEAMDMLMAYAWPGNVRELASVIERALGLCDGEIIQVEHLPDALTKG